MRRNKLWALTLIGAMTVGSLAGCGKKEAPAANTSTQKNDAAQKKQVKLKVWGPQEDQAAPADKNVKGYDKGWLVAMCDKFNEAHPEWDIQFEYGVCAEGDVYKTIKNDVEAAADVYMVANDQIPDLVSTGAIAQLGGATVDAVKADNDQTLVDSVTYNEKVYGVPFTSNTWFMYYDKSKYSEDEIKSLDTMMAKDLGNGVYNVGMKLDNSWYIPSFFFAAGCNLFGENGTDAAKGCEFNNEAGVGAAKYVMELAKSKKFALDKDNDSISKFKAGKLGAFFSGSWDYTAIKEALGDNCGVAALPTIKVNGQDGQMKSFSGSKAVAVNPNSKNPQVAVALAAFLGGQEAQQAHYEARGIIPTNKAVLASEAVAKDEVAQVQQQVIASTSKVQPILKEMGQFWTPVESFAKEVCQGDVKEDNVKAKLDSMVQGIAVTK